MELGGRSLDQGIERLRKQGEIGRRREAVVAVLDQRDGDIAAREPFGEARLSRHGTDSSRMPCSSLTGTLTGIGFPSSRCFLPSSISARVYR